MQPTTNRRWVSLLLLACPPIPIAMAAAPRHGALTLTEFYVVSEAFSDAGPHWSHYTLDVKPDGRDTIVRYIRIAPLSAECWRAVTVKATESRLKHTTPATLLGNINPLCG